MREKVLITGASGFVGFHLVEAALAAGMEVHAAVRKSSSIEHMSVFNVKYVYPDYNNQDALRRELELRQYDYIIHAAGITKARNRAAYDAVNAGYTKQLAQAAQATGTLKKFIHISSLAAVGPVNYTALEPIGEDNRPQPVTSYGQSKLLAEQYLMSTTGLPYIILRPTAVYGPRERDILIMFKTIGKGWEPYIGRAPQWLSFIYVKDLAQAVIKAMRAPVANSIYHISDGYAYDRYALAQITKQLLHKKTMKLHIPHGIIKLLAGMMETATRWSEKSPVLSREKLQELTAANWHCSIEKIGRELSFVPEYNLEKGLSQTLQWYKSNNWL